MIKIAEIMAKHGHRAYAVGGCVRDYIMGRVPSDWDMTTDAAPDEMVKIFEREGVRMIPTGLKHGTLTVLLGGESFELTTFRIDGSYTDSRHPDTVTFTRDIHDDLSRRDFTVNAMALDPLCDKENSEHIIIDAFGGQADIKNKLIRAVGDPERRFQEDALRILRAVRFAATLGFEIEEKTKNAAKKLSAGLKNVSAERKKVEVEKMLISDGADRGTELLFELGLTEYIHKGLNLPKISLSSLPKRFETRMAALFSKCDGAIDLAPLRLSRAEASNIKLLCDREKFCTELCGINARRMIAVYGSLAPDAAYLNGGGELAELIENEMKKAPCVKISQLKISGNDLISLGIEPRDIGEIMSSLLQRVIDEPELNEKEKLLALAKNLM